MRDIVLVPIYYRPEYLWLCLENISKATPGTADREIWLLQDFRFEDQHRNKLGEDWTREVRDYWESRLPLRFIRRAQHGFEGNSMNVLEGYKEAYQCEDARYIYLIEEDVLVRPDFFTWHEAVQSDGDYFCAVAYRCSRNNEARSDVKNPSAYFTSARDYASIGVSWRREKLEPVIQHASVEYYKDLPAYMLKTFPGNRFQKDFAEQDGAIMRCLWEAYPTRIAWPYVPRCFHIGFYGYHRPDGVRPNGLLQEKITRLRSIIYNKEEIQKVSRNFGDIESIPMEPPKLFHKLYRIQDFS